LSALADSRRTTDIPTMARLFSGLHLDGMLLTGLTAIMLVGLLALYSAVGQSASLLLNQVTRMGAALAVMLALAQIDPAWLRRLAPWLYVAALGLLGMVLLSGDIGKGAQRWLDIGVRFQPSEVMKLGVPLMLAWVLHERPLPPSFSMIVACLALVLLPVGMIALQPDLGTAIMITASGAAVIYLAGIGIGYIIGAAGVALVSLPALWYFVMHDYQKRRVLTLFDPDRDPLGAGYHIIQSKIAIGSGGLFGKGWLNGSQGQLEFLPERSTDFIFAVIGEEFGLMGAVAILLIYLLIVGRGLYTFGRLLAGSISLTFFFYAFVNTAMVTGLLPVVGVPLPLISFGGTSMVTLLAGFGILMSIQTHRKLLAR
jgi:rod shape determining protein RodA